MVINLPWAAPTAASSTVRANASVSLIRWSAANDAITAPGLRCSITAAASAMAAHESLARGSTRMLRSGTSGS
jgi:hypothetical protein